MTLAFNQPYWDEIKQSKTPVLIHPCSVCGQPNAPFGFGVTLRKDKLGTWFCADHKQEAKR